MHSEFTCYAQLCFLEPNMLFLPLPAYYAKSICSILCVSLLARLPSLVELLEVTGLGSDLVLFKLVPTQRRHTGLDPSRAHSNDDQPQHGQSSAQREMRKSISIVRGCGLYIHVHVNSVQANHHQTCYIYPPNPIPDPTHSLP